MTKGSELRVNGHPIQALRYVPRKEVVEEVYLDTFDEVGRPNTILQTKVYDAKWLGTRLDHNDKIEVNEDYVVETFGERFASELKVCTKQKYVPVPIGSVHASRLHQNPGLVLHGAPDVKFQ